MSTRRSERLRRLSETLEQGETLRLRDAAALFAVSEMTVRRDLAASGDAFRYLGGHILKLAAGAGKDRYVLDDERSSHTDAKIAASASAVTFLENDDTIFVDCGTTLPHFARRIPATLRLTAVCYSLEIAEILATKPNVRLILLGGLYHPSSASFACEEGLELLRTVGINKAFLSAAGVEPARGTSCMHFHEVAVKQAAIAGAVHRYLVVDSSKFGRVKPAFFATSADFEKIVTDRGTDALYRSAPEFEGRLLIAD